MDAVKRGATAVFRRVVGFAFFALAVGFLDLILIGGQWLWHIPGRMEVTHLKDQLRPLKEQLDLQRGQLEEKATGIKRLESRIDTLDRRLKDQQSQLSQLRGTIDAQAVDLRGALPGADANSYHAGVAAFNVHVREYNETLDQRHAQFADYQQAITDYNTVVNKRKEMLSDYNLRVDRINRIASDAGSYWYIIPIPIPVPGRLAQEAPSSVGSMVPHPRFVPAH